MWLFARAWLGSPLAAGQRGGEQRAGDAAVDHQPRPTLSPRLAAAGRARVHGQLYHHHGAYLAAGLALLLVIGVGLGLGNALGVGTRTGTNRVSS